VVPVKALLINNVIRYVVDQDRSIAFWTQTMGFELRTDARMMPAARWVEVCPPGRETGIALLRAADFDVQPMTGPAGFTIVVDDVKELYARLLTAGITVTEPVEEEYGSYVTMTCPDGYQHVISQLKTPAPE
jgi:lactoylglutathione lyase